MKSIATVILISMYLVGCATSTPAQGPNGANAFVIKCASGRIEACYKEASSVCPNGYTIVDKQADGNGMITSTGTSLMMMRGPSSMLVECKKQVTPN